MKEVTLIGAGGKMGIRLTQNLMNSDYKMSYLEISEKGIERLNEKGIEIDEGLGAVRKADMVIFAVPDVSLGRVTAQYVPIMKTGALAVTLDPAAALAGKLHHREDVSCFIAHPSHPSIFNWEPEREAMKDHFGGQLAHQTIVCALLKGSEADYREGEGLAKTFYAPVSKAFRITAEQMGLLEPALVETLSSTCIYIIREGLNEVIKLGVPAEAAREFLLGHLRIQMAVLFDEIPGAVFSDAANKALQRGLKEFIREDWRKVFDPENVREQIRAIT